MRILIAIIAWSLCACSLEIPNGPICVDKAKFGAVCDFTRPPYKTTQVSKFDWDKQRVGWLCLNPKLFGDYKEFVEKACQKDQRCIDGVRRVIELSESGVTHDTDNKPTDREPERVVEPKPDPSVDTDSKKGDWGKRDDWW